MFALIEAGSASNQLLMSPPKLKLSPSARMTKARIVWSVWILSTAARKSDEVALLSRFCGGLDRSSVPIPFSTVKAKLAMTMILC